MAGTIVPLTVFTKPWNEESLPGLGEFISRLGFDGIELPVRPGFQVEPEKVQAGLPRAVKILADFGLRIYSIAGPTDEQTIAACGEAGIPIIRVLVPIDQSKGYMATIDEVRKQYESLVPVLDRHGVAIGVQNHWDSYIGSALGIVHAIEPFDRKHVCAVLDIAHCALAGEPEEMAIDIAWPRLAMVNLKNAVRRRAAGPETDEVTWEIYWTSGRQGFASWRRTSGVLKRRDYRGPICLTAEYSDSDAADRLISEDIAFAKELFAGTEVP
jgi:sugar phosphate isomerase/epimerase